MESNQQLNITAVLLVTAAVLVACNIYTMIPLYETIAADFRISSASAAYGSSFFTFFYAVGLLCFGPVSERIGRKKTLVGGLFFSTAATFCVALSPSPEFLYISRALQGFSLASFAPVAFAYTFDIFPPVMRTLVLALINTGFLIAGIAGQLISSVITKFAGWPYTFLFFSLIYLLLFLCSIKVLRPMPIQPAVKANVFFIFLSHLRNVHLIKCYIITFTLLLSFVSFYEALAKHFSSLSITDHEIFLVRAVGLFGTTLSLFTRKIINSVGEKRTLQAGLSLCIISLLLIALHPFIFTIAFSSILFVGAISLLIPTVITYIGYLALQERAAAISLYSFILLSGASIGPLLVSLFTFQYAVLLLVNLFLLNLLLSRFLPQLDNQISR